MLNSRRSSDDPRIHAEAEIRLDALFRSYKDACPVPDGGANFMPELWAKIERRKSTSLFTRGARVLVTAALAVTAILSVMLSIDSPSGVPTPGIYMEALVTDGESALDLLNPASLTDMEQQ